MFKKNFTILGSGVRPVAKAQVLSLFKEVFKWMGENTMSFGMHKEVQEELQKFSKNYAKEEMVIKRGLNSEKLKIAQNTI